jgi:3',5'-cyclic AMP phosphodiesterase CpdA
MTRHEFRFLAFVLLLAMAFAYLPNAAAARDKDKDKNKNDKTTQDGDVVIAQISDIHMGLAKAPNAEENLEKALDMIQQRGVDAIIVSGDIGERPPEREKVKQIVSSKAKVPVFWVAGNHDDSAHDTSSFTSIFGPDFYEGHVKFVTLLVLDSQLLGNYDNFNATSPEPLAPEGQAQSDKMLSWLGQPSNQPVAEGKGDRGEGGNVILEVQHVPLDRGSGFPEDSKPYWTSQEPYRSKTIAQLKKLGVRDVLAGHLHHGAEYSADGLKFHLAPAIGYPIGDPGGVGFAIHTIKPNGDVKTEMVYLAH